MAVALALGLGLYILLSLFEALGRRGPRRGLALWALAIIASVILGHNFSGARYYAPGAVALGLLWWRQVEGKRGVEIALGLSILLAGAVAWADLAWARAYPPLMAQADQHLQANPAQGTIYFSGEWTFRWEAERRGYQGLLGAMPKGGDLLIIAPGAGAPPVPEGLIEEARFEGPAPWLRTHDVESGVGLYSEIFGLLPFGPGEGPIDAVEIWRWP